MLKKLSFVSGLRGSSPSSSSPSEKGKIIKYSSSSKKYHGRRDEDDDDDGLDEVAVISSATPENVTYGQSQRRSSYSNGPPRLVPGIITSTGFESKPYVPATCTMQPKISSSVIQSTASGGGQSSRPSTNIAVLSSVVASSSSSYPSTSTLKEDIPSASTSTDVTGGKGRMVRARRDQEDGDRLVWSTGRGGTGSPREDEDESDPLLSSQPIQTISSKVTTITTTSSSSHHRSVPTTTSSINAATTFTSGGVKKGSTTIFTSKSSGLTPTIIKGGGSVMTTMSSKDQSPSKEASGHVTKKMREARRKEIKKEFDKTWEESATGSVIEKSGCNWTFVFDPSGRLVYYWSMIVSLAFVYNAWVITYRFAFDEINPETVVMWLSLDGVSDIIYVLDVVVHFRIGYLEEGVLQTNASKLRQHYVNSTLFYIDCLCLLPLDFLYLSIGFNSILRCFRLVKIYRFWAFMDRTERHTNYPNVFRTLSLFHYILVLFHWNACVYHMISTRGGFGSSDWFEGSRDREFCFDVSCDYLHAFYWSTLALTTIGDLPRPRTKGEYLFLIVELVLGLFLLASVLGHVANIVTNVSAARKEFQAKLDAVKTYMRMRRVPEHLKIKVIKWFDYLWMTQKSSDEEKSVGFLPAKLKAEIAIHVHLDTLKRVEIFQNTEAGFLCALVLRLKPVLFSPSDYVCRKGEIGKEMFIVNRGRLQVVADNGKTVLATLRAGSYFGEISILNMGTAGNRRTASVRSVGYSDLFCLNKNDLWDVLKDYPAARVRLEAIAVKRLEKYRKEPLKKISMGRSRSFSGLEESKSQVNLAAVNNNNRSPGGDQSSNVNEESTDEKGVEPEVPKAEPTTFSSAHLTLYQYPPPPNLSTSSSRGHSPLPPTYTSILLHPHPSYYIGSSSTTTNVTSSIKGMTSTEEVCSERRTSSPSIPKQLTFQQPPRQTVSPAQSVPLLMPRSELTRTPIPGEFSQELLISEIKRLRDKLSEMEEDNTSLAHKLSQQSSQMELRLAEIETHIQSRHPSSSRQVPHPSRHSSSMPSPSSSTLAGSHFSPVVIRDQLSEERSTSPTPSSPSSTSADDSERNKESII